MNFGSTRPPWYDLQETITYCGNICDISNHYFFQFPLMIHAKGREPEKRFSSRAEKIAKIYFSFSHTFQHAQTLWLIFLPFGPTILPEDTV